MIIELFGLPASGKSTRARAWADGERVVRVRDLSVPALLYENLLFSVRYPVRTLQLLGWSFRSPKTLRRSLFINLFLVNNAKYHIAQRISRSGRIAIIDQGHFQNLLSLFAENPTDAEIAAYLAILPRPDILAVCEVDEPARHARLTERGQVPRAEFGAAEAQRIERVAEVVYPRALACMKEAGVAHVIAREGESLGALLAARITYASIARMPTEKAHGASIAHMCTAFAETGSTVELIVPFRKNQIAEDVSTYYAVPPIFGVRYLEILDFIGWGFTHPFFFLLQRLAFVRALKRARVPQGILYTREPELASAFFRTHYTILEMHRWPSGLAGAVTARLAQRAALVVCNSRGTEAAARRAGITRTIVAPNGFDPHAFEKAESRRTARSRLGLPEDTPIALYIGSLETHKGVEILCEAAHFLAPAVSVAVIGGTKKEIAAFQKRFPSVQFLGTRPYRELADNLAAGDVLVLPNTAHDEESAHYTSPIKVFGYMAAHRPIVAAALPSVRETLDETCAFLVVPDDPEALADGIRTALGSPEEAEERVVVAAQRAQEFTWHHRALRVLAALPL